MPKKQGLLERLAQGEVLCAEGYVFELERRGYVKAGAFVPEVVVDHPEALRQLHREFDRAGSDVVVALTYYAHREKLRAIGREDDLEEINRQALAIARDIANGSGALLAGNICNTWAYDPADPRSADEVRRQYTEQVQWAAEAGVDFVLAETIEWLGEALIALEVIKSFNLRAVINFLPMYPQSKDDVDWIKACKDVKAAGADVIGFNCGRGPRTMLPLINRLREAVDGPIAAVPVPYRTTPEVPAFMGLQDEQGRSDYTVGLDRHMLTRDEMAAFAVRARELGASYIGICCGAGPHHVRAMAEALGRTTPASRYSPDLSQHALLGGAGFVKRVEKQFKDQWA